MAEAIKDCQILLARRMCAVGLALKGNVELNNKVHFEA